jgi:class 3 adenylate cyclase
MAQTRVRQTPRWKRFAVGVALTAALSLVYLLIPAVPDIREPRTQDRLLWQVRPPQVNAPEITIVEIDDGSLARVGKWPWHWRDLAGMIESLHALGARVIALDITFSEMPGAEPPPEAQAGEKVVLTNPLEPLEAAVADSKSSVLTYTLFLTPQVPGALYERLEKILAAKPDLAADAAAAQLGVAPAEVEKIYLTALKRAVEMRLEAEPEELCLAAAPPANDQKVASQLRLRIFPALQAKLAVREALSPRELTQQDIFEKSLRFARRAAILNRRGTVPYTGDRRSEVLPVAQRVDPPLAELTGVAAGLGFESVVPDDDGVIRRVPLVMRYGDNVYPHLALRAAMMALGRPQFEISATRPNRIEVVHGADRFSILVGSKADLTVNWSSPRDGNPDGFRHLPISLIAQHFSLTEINRRYEEALTLAARLFPKVAGNRAALVEQVRQAHRRAATGAGAVVAASATTMSGGPGNVATNTVATAPAPAAGLKDLEDRLAALDDQLARELTTLVGSGLDKLPAGVSKEDFARAVEQLNFLRDLRDDNRAIRHELAALEVQLEPYLRDRVCLVGMTATSAALDLKPTPLARAYPGVDAHACVIDNILRRSFVTEAGWLNKLAMLLAVGLTVTLLAGAWPTIRATVAAVIVLAAYYGLCLLLFWWAGLLMPVAGPALAGAIALLGVMIFRELTEGRERRWITDVFKQYTSDRMVDELVANPDFLVLGGQKRELTYYFSDIAGFTSISERLKDDPPRLVKFLNMYLEEMTDRLLEQDGTLDKYMGDAIIAHFGALAVMPDHAARCLRAALAHLRAMPLVDDQLRAAGLLPEGVHLRARIGVSTGSVTVGNFGSSRRFEYTAIGDPVNVGSRLEGANRYFGTTVLLSGETRRQVGEEFLVRRIGPVRFVGKAEAIEVWQLLDGEVPDARSGLTLYDEALAEFEQGLFHEARDKFKKVLELRPDDGPTLAYLTRLDGLLRDDVHAPPGPWDMTSK